MAIRRNPLPGSSRGGYQPPATGWLLRVSLNGILPVMERSEATLALPLGELAAPCGGGLRGSAFQNTLPNHQTEHPLSQPVRLTALPKGEPRAQFRSPPRPGQDIVSFPPPNPQYLVSIFHKDFPHEKTLPCYLFLIILVFHRLSTTFSRFLRISSQIHQFFHVFNLTKPCGYLPAQSNFPPKITLA